ncbi:hypothetical protein HN450_03120 [bacterium]|jgi:hypothetical protein|nr:hypothetical protein [bacterium]MBT3850050.1 hypothetical protein [bacterium]MBT4435361.1 hypothetical protein [bacterium]
MISINRSNKGVLTEATGKRVQKRSIYDQNTPFELSRGKFSDFLSCKRCFYFDRVLGVKVPDMPGWTLNSTVDDLLKKEFDICREKQIPHRIMLKSNLENIVPYKDVRMDEWRDALRRGIKYKYKDSNITLKGGIDDLWYNNETQEIIIVDYKSQSSSRPVTTEDYLSSIYHENYKIQLDFYAYLFLMNNFLVSKTAFFYVANCRKHETGFNSKLIFDETLVPYRLKTHWIEEKIDEMISVLNSKKLPDINPFCQNCACALARSEYE